MAIKICLDAGHYGKYNRSPGVPEYYESEMNWKLHLLLKEALEAYGMEVTLTRQEQTEDLALSARGRAAEGCDLFLSIHSNAAGSAMKEAVDYPVVYVPLNGTGDNIGKALADCIAAVMGTRQPGRINTRKGNRGDYYGVIRGAVSVGVPGLILEHSFHTNTRATRWLLQEENLRALAKAEAAVLAACFGVDQPPFADVQPTDAGYEAVRWAWRRGLTGSQPYFYPDCAVTRAELAQVLYALHGEVKS